jgi:hypothetical protein
MASIIKAPNTVSQSGDTGLAWSNLDYAKIVDGLAATTAYATLSPINARPLILTNFGFAIPADSVIKGVQANVVRRGYSTGSSPYVRDVSVLLYYGVYPVANCQNKASTTDWSLTDFRGDIFGGTTDLWGTQLTPTIVNSSSFGLYLTCVAYSSSGPPNGTRAEIDGVSLTIWYDAPGAGVRMTDPYGAIIYT